MGNRVIKGKSATEKFGKISGNNKITLKVDNYPSIRINSQTSQAGNHSHTYTNTGTSRRGLGRWENKIFQLYLMFQGNFNTSTASVNHNHTASKAVISGSRQSINLSPKKYTTNYFIYLGL